MILNRLIVTRGNTLEFHLNYIVDDEEYSLKSSEYYYINIASADAPNILLSTYTWRSNDFSNKVALSAGIYVFEIGIRSSSTTKVLVPALDERNRPLNQLIVLKRLGDSDG